VLLGRHSEGETLDRLVDAVRSGESRSLVVRGEAGVGKSALLDHVARRASGCRVARAVGVRSERRFPFAALHQLCAPMFDRLDRIPGPQRDALRTTFGQQAGSPPDPFLVALATLSLLADVADERPLLCLVDDAQWLDRQSIETLAFVARRATADSVGLVFSLREPSDEPWLSGLPELRVDGLRHSDARALLDSVIWSPVDERVRDTVVAETRGNPSALLELARHMSAAQLAGGFGLATTTALSGRLEDRYEPQLAALAPDVRQLLLVAAAEPIGDPRLIWHTADRLGLEIDAPTLATAAALIEIRPTVHFRHPLLRSAIYRLASPEERRRAHAALAQETSRESDPDRRAWHRAHATAGPDEGVAAELERFTGRAQARGGLSAAAAFLERAAGLTPDSGRRAKRALAAAQAKHDAGAPDAALDLLATVERSPLDDLQRGRAGLLRAQVGLAVNGGRSGIEPLLAAAQQLEPLDVTLARETYLDALSAATAVGRLAGKRRLRDVATAARAAPPSAQRAQASDLLLDGLAITITEGCVAGAPVVKQALRAFRHEDITAHERQRWLSLAAQTALSLWDHDTCEVLATRHMQFARDTGALTTLPIAMHTRVAAHLSAGELAAARTLLDEMNAIADITRTHVPPYARAALAALQGREAQAAPLIEHTMAEALSRGDGMALAVTQWATAMLCNALGRYEDAMDAVAEASDHPEELWFSAWGSAELVEAASRTSDTERATAALRRLAQTTQPSSTDLALGIEARSRALLSEGEDAETLYREAIDRLSRTRLSLMLARTHLVYGEWLRRERRRLDARAELRTAHQMFEAMGLEAFAQRAAGELLATGETARRRTADTRAQLTPQEAHIARLARDQLSNPEIGTRLFISRRTVEYHLSKVFTKLDITSRNQLDRALPPDIDAAQPA
jgi:DNA-binding CsgD family transcriptional regulator